MAPAVKRRSSSILRHVTAAAAAITPAIDGNGDPAPEGSGAAGAAGGAVAADGVGAVKRASLLSVAMRSRAAAAAVEGANYEEEVRGRADFFDYFASQLCEFCSILTARKKRGGTRSKLERPPSRSNAHQLTTGTIILLREFLATVVIYICMYTLSEGGGY